MPLQWQRIFFFYSYWQQNAGLRLIFWLNAIQTYFPLEKRGAVGRVRTGVLFLQKITCSNWNWGRVPALIFSLGMNLSVRENCVCCLCLRSCLRSIPEGKRVTHCNAGGVSEPIISNQWLCQNLYRGQRAYRFDLYPESQRSHWSCAISIIFLIYPSLKRVFEKLLNAGKQHVPGSHFSLSRKGK